MDMLCNAGAESVPSSHLQTAVARRMEEHVSRGKLIPTRTRGHEDTRDNVPGTHSCTTAVESVQVLQALPDNRSAGSQARTGPLCYTRSRHKTCDWYKKEEYGGGFAPLGFTICACSSLDLGLLCAGVAFYQHRRKLGLRQCGNGRCVPVNPICAGTPQLYSEGPWNPLVCAMVR